MLTYGNKLFPSCTWNCTTLFTLPNKASCIKIKEDAEAEKQCNSDLDCHKGRCKLNKATGKPYCECDDPMYDGEFCDHYICAGVCQNGGMCFPIWLPPPATSSNFTFHFKPVMLKCSCRQGYKGKGHRLPNKNTKYFFQS